MFLERGSREGKLRRIFEKREVKVDEGDRILQQM